MPKSSGLKPKSQNPQSKKPKASKVATFAPVSTSVMVTNQKPKMSSKSNGKITVRHREYITDVNGSITFGLVGYNINPGLTNAFVWLSQIAQNFEKYQFKRLVFYYETQKSTASSGTLMLGFDFDVAENGPANKPILMSYQPSTRSAVWQETCLIVDRKDLSRAEYLFVRNGLLASNLDIKTYDVGKLWVATQGCADTTAIGELYVDYEVDLWIPQTQPQGTAVDESLRATFTTAGQGVSIGAIFGNGAAGNIVQGSTIFGGLNVGFNNNSQLTFFEIGGYMLHITLVGTGFTTGAPVLSGTVANSTIVQNFVAATATQGSLLVIVNVTNPFQTLTIDVSSLGTTVTQSITRIGSYAYSNS